MKRLTLVLTVVLMAAVVVLAVPDGARTEDALVHGAASEPRSLDPYFHSETPTNSMNKNIYDCLLDFDKDLNVRPALARFLGESGQYDLGVQAPERCNIS